MSKPVIQVIVTTTRPSRIGHLLGQHIFDQIKDRDDVDVELVDLVDFNLPVFDEPNHPATGQYVTDHTKKWSQSVSRADGFIFVMAEYNHSFSGSFKNALDYLSAEWRNKPATLASYSVGVSAGLRAAVAITPVMNQLRIRLTANAINIPFIGKLIQDGKLESNEIIDGSIDKATNELIGLTASG